MCVSLFLTDNLRAYNDKYFFFNIKKGRKCILIKKLKKNKNKVFHFVCIIIFINNFY